MAEKREKPNGQFGYQPGGNNNRGSQPSTPGQGYQPTNNGSGNHNPVPPSGGTSVQEK